MAFDSPPHFRKIMLHFFNNGYGRIYARRYKGQIVWKLKFMHMISRDGDHSEGWRVGVSCRLEPFRKFIRFGTLTRPLDWYDYQSQPSFPKLGLWLIISIENQPSIINMLNYFDIAWCSSFLLLIIHDYFKKCESFPICRIPSVKFWWLMGIEIRGSESGELYLRTFGN